MLVVFSIAPIPEINAPDESQKSKSSEEQESSLLHEKHYLFGILSQFFYCAGQTAIFSVFITFVRDERNMPSLPLWLTNLLPETMKYFETGGWHLTEYAAGVLLSGAFVFFTAGRFLGSLILRYFSPHLTLGIYALTNMLLMLLVILNLGWISVGALILSFFFMSIMYPTNFALAIRGLGGKTKIASSGMVTAILGSGFGPIAVGWIADQYGMPPCFILPFICFAFIMFYGFSWRRLFAHDMKPEHGGSETLTDGTQVL